MSKEDQAIELLKRIALVDPYVIDMGMKWCVFCESPIHQFGHADGCAHVETITFLQWVKNDNDEELGG